MKSLRNSQEEYRCLTGLLLVLSRATRSRQSAKCSPLICRSSRTAGRGGYWWCWDHYLSGIPCSQSGEKQWFQETGSHTHCYWVLGVCWWHYRFVLTTTHCNTYHYPLFKYEDFGAELGLRYGNKVTVPEFKLRPAWCPSAGPPRTFSNPRRRGGHPLLLLW